MVRISRDPMLSSTQSTMPLAPLLWYPIKPIIQPAESSIAVPPRDDTRPQPNTIFPGAIYVVNARSLAKNHAINQLHAELLGYDIDIAIVTETFFKKRHTAAASAIKGYRTHRRDRPDRRQGWVAIHMYVSEDIPSSDCQIQTDQNQFELL